MNNNKPRKAKIIMHPKEKKVVMRKISLKVKKLRNQMTMKKMRMMKVMMNLMVMVMMSRLILVKTPLSTLLVLMMNRRQFKHNHNPHHLNKDILSKPLIYQQQFIQAC